MTRDMTQVLVVDDDAEMLAMLELSLGRRGFAVTAVGGADAALEALRLRRFDAVVTDLRMKGLDGIALCERVGANAPGTPVIVMTAFGNLDAAVGAMRAGAADFLAKPFKPDVLALTLERTMRQHQLEAEVSRLRSRLDEVRPFGELLGDSGALRELQGTLSRAATTDATVLITGETGTGKELCARALHARGARAARPFVAINCAAVPEALLESELFGHERGAFTDARTARGGLFQRASGGTLFLDEVGDMPLALQPKLLRALQERLVRPVGGDREVPVDVRLIAATHQDLQALIRTGTFRKDLFFRLDVIHVEVPPLRARGNDVLLLAQHFVQRFAAALRRPVRGLSSEVARRLLAYDWPGNVRELSNCIERAVAMTDHAELVVDDLPPRLRAWPEPDAPGGPTDDPLGCVDEGELLPLDAIERQHILRVVRAVGGNKAKAARVLGLDRKTLYRRLELYGEREPASEEEGKGP